MPESFWRSVHELAEGEGPVLHMPGHGNLSPVSEAWGGQALPTELMRLDQSEIGGLDYLHDPQDRLKTAQQRAARVFGANATWFLVNGATVGNLAAVWSVARPGGRLLLARRSHQSSHAAAAMAALRTSYLSPLPHAPLDGLFGIDLDELRAQLEGATDIVGVHVTSPDYYGFRLPLDQIAAICHYHRVPLIVDEAHGGHLTFVEGEATALSSGADVVVHSPHKTLGSLTQSALLHVQGDLVDHDRVSEALVLLQSSSPSSLLTMSLDAIVEDLEVNGKRLWRERADWADQVREHRIDGRPLFLLQQDLPRGVVATDPCKLVVTQPQWQGSLDRVRRSLLADFGIRPEFADHRTLVFSVVRGTTEAHVHGLADALLAVLQGQEAAPDDLSTVALWPQQPPEQAWEPRMAMQAPRRTLPLAEAAGQVAARAITPYPPGVPLVLPGEVISTDAVRVIRALLADGGVVRGLVTGVDGDVGAICVHQTPPTAPRQPTAAEREHDETIRTGAL